MLANSEKEGFLTGTQTPFLSPQRTPKNENENDAIEEKWFQMKKYMQAKN